MLRSKMGSERALIDEDLPHMWRMSVVWAGLGEVTLYRTLERYAQARKTPV